MAYLMKVRKSAVYVCFGKQYEERGFLVVSWRPRYIRWIGREE